jgi:hypothetical protein
MSGCGHPCRSEVEERSRRKRFRDYAITETGFGLAGKDERAAEAKTVRSGELYWQGLCLHSRRPVGATLNCDAIAGTIVKSVRFQGCLERATGDVAGARGASTSTFQYVRSSWPQCQRRASLFAEREAQHAC